MTMTVAGSMAATFTRAYATGQWHHGSGSGSSPANTARYRRFLAAYFTEHHVKSVLDIGCGDWQSTRLINWTGIEYTGIDLVPEVVLRNHFRYGHQRNLMFAVADALTVPRLLETDLVIVKDLLQHWPDTAIGQLEERLAGRRALLTYDLRRDGAHADTEPGGYRPLDLTRLPFRWPVPERLRYISVSHEGRVRRVKVTVELTP